MRVREQAAVLLVSDALEQDLLDTIPHHPYPYPEPYHPTPSPSPSPTLTQPLALPPNPFHSPYPYPYPLPLEQDLLGTPSLLAAVRAAAASWRSGILAERSKQAFFRVRVRVRVSVRVRVNPNPG